VRSVATTLATVSLKAMSAAKLTAAAEKTAGHAKIDAKIQHYEEERTLLYG
jgi:hypothetical protein